MTIRATLFPWRNLREFSRTEGEVPKKRNGIASSNCNAPHLGRGRRDSASGRWSHYDKLLRPSHAILSQGERVICIGENYRHSARLENDSRGEGPFPRGSVFRG